MFLCERKTWLTGKHKTGNTGNEAGQECVERKSANHQTVDELQNARDEDVKHVGIDDLEALWCSPLIVHIQLAQCVNNLRHFC